MGIRVGSVNTRSDRGFHNLVHPFDLLTTYEPIPVVPPAPSKPNPSSSPCLAWPPTYPHITRLFRQIAGGRSAQGPDPLPPCRVPCDIEKPGHRHLGSDILCLKQ